MAEQDISLVERQRRAIKFYVRLGKSGSEILQLTLQDYGDDAMRRAVVFKWWKRFRDGETNVKNELRSDQGVKTARSKILLKLAANDLQDVSEKWVERCKKSIA
jgi:hypothetical protein